MLKKFGIISATIAAMLAIVASVPVLATETTTEGGTAGDNARTVEHAEVAPTFSQEVSEEQDTAQIHFGQSLIFAGNNAKFNGTTSGLLLAFGNGLTLSSRSEYAFVAGNEVNFSATTERDLFAAGNIINLLPDAKIGRDVFVAAYRVKLETDLNGSFSVTGSQAILKDVRIAGNVNLSVESVSFEGTVEVAGTLIYNDDAIVSGLEHVQAGTVETYTPEVRVQTAADFWLSEVTSIVSLFVAAVIVFAIWPRARAEATDEHALAKAAGNLAYGFIFLLAVPFIVILLIMSYIAAPLGIIMILAYIIMIYLSQAFTGAWIGHLILAKGLQVRLPIFAEVFVGILVLSCLSLFPGLSFIVGFLAIIFGLGMMVRCLKPQKSAEIDAADGKNSKAKSAKVGKAAKNASSTNKPKAIATSKIREKSSKQPSKLKSGAKK